MSLFDMMGMMGKMGELKNKPADAKAARAKKIESFSSEDGKVTLHISGARQITSLAIAPELLSPEKAEELQNLLIKTINKGISEMETAVKKEVGEIISSNLPMQIPGLDFSNLI